MVDTNRDIDRALVRRYASGDTSSFTDLVERYERSIYNLAYRTTANSADAADLTQEIFLTLHRKISQYRGDAAFFTWFYRLAVNCGNDWLRKEARRTQSITIEEVMLPDGGMGPSQVAEQKEVQQLVQAAIFCLPEDQRLVVILHDLQSYNYQEIADILGVPVGTVKSRLARARCKLAEKLAPHGNITQE
ncbi:MAG TPA: sigma-70 family RNA polymerase sigma factor [Candidatus Aquicultor sp.]